MVNPMDPRFDELRAAQAEVIRLSVPDIESLGALATPRHGGLLDDRVVSQRIQVELPTGTFDEEAVLQAALTVWNPKLDERFGYEKVDGALRLDMLDASGGFHSVTFLHEHRVLQITSFTASTEDEIAEPGTQNDVRRSALDAEEQIFGPNYGYELQAG